MEVERFLPTSFHNVLNVIVNYETVNTERNFFNASVRSSIRTKSDIKQWVAEFGETTKTNWRVRSTSTNSARVACKQDYVCQHSDFNRGSGVKVYRP